MALLQVGTIYGRCAPVAAINTFDSFNASLSEEDRKILAEFTKAQRADLLAARSEDERVRLVQKYVLEVMERLHK